MKPADHVRPRKQNRDFDRFAPCIFGAPDEYADGIARLTTVVRENRRELLARKLYRESGILVLEPRLGKKRIVLTRSRWIVPVPRGKGFFARWLARTQYDGNRLTTLFLLVCGENVRGYGA